MSAVRAPDTAVPADRPNGKAAEPPGGPKPTKATAGASGTTRLLQELLEGLQAAAAGHVDVRVSTRHRGQAQEVAQAFNDFMEQNSRYITELVEVTQAVGRDGRTTERMDLGAATGVWATRVEAVNGLIDDLVRPTNEVARVISAVAEGDLTQKMPLIIDGHPMKGEFASIGRVVNSMVDLLSAFSAEVTRVAGDVGTEGRLGGQAEMQGVSGAWRDLTDSVNQMASNLTDQVRNIALVTTAVANGDLSQKITVDARGEVAELKETVNRMVDQLQSFANEVTRVAREVGTEGRLGGQAEVPGVSGTWKALTDNVNQLAGNLTSQVRNIAQVTTAVAQGDLSQKITVDARGEVAQLKDTVNTMVDQLSAFADEVTRVAWEVGTEGRLGGQAKVVGVAGTWKDLTDSVNSMAANLTDQVRDIARVTTAVATGDLSQKILVDVRGEILELKRTVNTMVDQLGSFADEVTRVAREVGTEGNLGGQAEVEGASGTWKALTDNVNQLAGNLTSQVRNIAGVTKAVARGDLSQKITVEARGEVAELKDTINTMVDQLSSFADEVTRVAREVGTEGQLGGQADVPGVSGTWKALTDNVNQLASNLTGQVRNIAQVTTAVAQGDLSQKITVDARGEILQLKNTINTMVDQLSSFADEVTRVAREVGTEGRLGGQAIVPGVSGTWKDLTDNVNKLASNLTSQVRNIAMVTTAVAQGDLSRKITVELRGELLELKDTVNTMVDQLSAWTTDVTRVAREVGTEGKLGGQAAVPGISGVWRDLTDSVNSMADNLTDQVRNIAQVTTAVAQGDLSQKITVDARGEILQLKNTVNKMVDQLSAFASEVTRVAREVGTEGKLGGQAEVEGVSGTWKRLTENVNQLAGNLTTQVRSIADVATAVTQGDLTRTITVDAAGELSLLKDNINQMIANLSETTERKEQQDWLNSNLARFGGMLQGHRDLSAVSRLIMSELTPLVGAQHGAFYMAADSSTAGETSYELLAGYGYKGRKGVSTTYRTGEGLVGQAALEHTTILVNDVGRTALRISTGMGDGIPVSIVVLPVLFEEQCLAVIELASFRPFTAINQAFLEQIVETVGVVLNTILATMRTEELLEQSQGLGAELQKRQRELQLTNAEIELARRELEERAEQLALSSKYKSEFLANMSHELRTPLNSLLILAKLLADNPDGNLTARQVEFARSMSDSGKDLLSLISDILDLSKVEAGKLDIALAPVRIADLAENLTQTFRPIAGEQALTYTVVVDADLPEHVTTDGHRVEQILKNLLSNAFKFTEAGSVTLRIDRAPHRNRFFNGPLATSPDAIAFSVLDTGIGIASDKLAVIFEAFQQAEGTTNRKFGGTGLGLSISREIARLLGGEIQVQSEPAQGSVFTLYLPALGTGRDHAVTAASVRKIDPVTTGPGGTPEPPGGAERAAVEDHQVYAGLAGRRILIIDDDVRNVYALTSALEERGIEVITAGSGRLGVESLEQNPAVDLVLMDIMMPDMDGYETTRAIRETAGFGELPIIALTAKAMHGDREKSLAAGASEHITKPVEIGQLLSLMRLWLPR